MALGQAFDQPQQGRDDPLFAAAVDPARNHHDHMHDLILAR